MRPEELKPGKSWRGSLICLTPQPDKYLYGQKQSGWMEVGMLRKTIVLMPDASWWPTEDQSHFRYFLGLWSHIASFACFSNLNLSWSDLGVEDAASGGVYKQDQLEHENMQHLHSPFISHNDSPWLTFTYLNALRGTSDSGCGFTSGYFLINGWTVLGLVKTQLGNIALSLHTSVHRV